MLYDKIPKRKGSHLEQKMAALFRRAGFNADTNVKIKSYEIDVFAYIGSYNIIVECKQYENSHLTIRNILHQWASKNNKYVKADRAVVAISGQKPSSEDYKVAGDLGIILLEDKHLNFLNSLSGEQLKEELNNLIRFDERLYREKQKKKFVKSALVIVFILLFSLLFTSIFKKIVLFVVAFLIIAAAVYLAINQRKLRFLKRILR